jgi:hypothetical protein
MITIVNTATSAQRRAESDSDGRFVVPVLPPGDYLVRAILAGFRPTELHGVALNVEDRVSLRVEMAVATGEEVTVFSEALRVNTSPAVGTVIDRRFVENLPLNGRSFHALLELTPGVVLAQADATGRGGGQFNINGQRSNENYFSVDGVSANAGMPNAATGLVGQAGSGQLPALTALGTTTGMVSVDALQEFRIQTSGYAPEFGRVPGGQVSLVTRSGTNVVRGSLFEYFRDEALDATDWFVNRRGEAEPELRQHNFGGVLGGPILRDQLFVFGSYEGVRLLLPRVGTASVPSVATRQAASPIVQPYLDVLPLPNGPDLGNGFGEFLAVYSDPSRVDSTSIRVDYNAGSRLRLFSRLSKAPSHAESRVPTYSFANIIRQDARSYTTGATWVISNRLVHDVRVGYATTRSPGAERKALAAGGAVVPTRILLPSGRPLDSVSSSISITGGGLWQGGTYQVNATQRQVNIVDSLTLTSRSHEWKLGVDFRRTSPIISEGDGGTEALVFGGVSDLLAGRVSSYTLGVTAKSRRAVTFDNLSLYGQDVWKLSPRVTLTYGVRWDVVPPPRASSGPEAVTLDNLDDPYGGHVGLAAPGTKFWRTRMGNVAPRIGGTYVLSENSSRPTVFKAGFGIFYGLGYGEIADAYDGYPFRASRIVPASTLPLSEDLLVPPVLGKDAPPQLFVTDPSLKLPYSRQWNVSVDQSLGPHHAVSVSYVGSSGHQRLKLERYRLNLTDWPTARSIVYVNRNRGYSDYHALQVQYQQRLHQGLQVLASYTLGKSADTGSSDVSVDVPAERVSIEKDYGASDYDVRHVMTAAATFNLPATGGPVIWSAVTRNWSVDGILRLRSGLPINVTIGAPFPPDTETVRADVVPDQPFWLEDANVPGRRRLNRQAFIAPPAQTQGNLRRGAIRGAGVSQFDMAVRRQFGLWRQVRFQVCIEMFNVLNTPTFSSPLNNLASANFGVSASMLNRSLGGLNTLYQIGGPRSMQLGTKLTF